MGINFGQLIPEDPLLHQFITLYNWINDHYIKIDCSHDRTGEDLSKDDVIELDVRVSVNINPAYVYPKKPNKEVFGISTEDRQQIQKFFDFEYLKRIKFTNVKCKVELNAVNVGFSDPSISNPYEYEVTTFGNSLDMLAYGNPRTKTINLKVTNEDPIGPGAVIVRNISVEADWKVSSFFKGMEIMGPRNETI